MRQYYGKNETKKNRIEKIFAEYRYRSESFQSYIFVDILPQVTCTELLFNPFSISSLFVIDIQDVNEAPYNLTISSPTVSENGPPGDFVGTLSVLDPDSPVRRLLPNSFFCFLCRKPKYVSIV